MGSTACCPQLAPSSRESHSQTFGWSENHGLRVRAHSAAGWSSPTTGVRVSTGAKPFNAEIYGVTFNSSNYINFKIRNFPPNTSWNIVFDHKGFGGVHDSCCNVNVNGSGNGYSWGGDYYVPARGGQLVITMTNPNYPTVRKTVTR